MAVVTRTKAIRDLIENELAQKLTDNIPLDSGFNDGWRGDMPHQGYTPNGEDGYSLGYDLAKNLNEADRKISELRDGRRE